MKVRKYIKRIIAWFIAFIIVFGVVGYMQENFFILNDYNSWRTRNYYREEKNSLDVVFIGSSNVFTDFLPGLAYKKYGFTSFPFGFDGQSNDVWKSQLIEITKTQSPKLIVVEISGALYNDYDKIFNDGAFRKYVDNMPLSKNKIDTLYNRNLNDDFLSYCFPVIKYHANYSDYKNTREEKRFFDSEQYSKLKGIVTLTKYDQRPSLYRKTSEKASLNPYTESQLISFLNYCKENNITNILFTRYPEKYIQTDSLNYIYRKNTAFSIIDSYGFDCCDFTDKIDEIGLDLNRDFYNEEHLNIYGAKKFTDYLGKVIMMYCNGNNHQLNSKQQRQWASSIQYTECFIKLAEEKLSQGKEELLCEDKKTLSMIEKMIKANVND